MMMYIRILRFQFPAVLILLCTSMFYNDQVIVPNYIGLHAKS